MTYETMCQYVFKQESVPWALSSTKSRKKNLVHARQLCMSLGAEFFNRMTLETLGLMFGKDHATVMHSKKTIKNEVETNRLEAQKYNEYYAYIKSKVYRDRKIVIDQASKDKAKMKRLLKAIGEFKDVIDVYCEITNQKLISK